jgi:hypothetical protein
MAVTLAGERECQEFRQRRACRGYGKQLVVNNDRCEFQGRFVHRGKRGRVIPLIAGARVFPEPQPREWAAPAKSSSEGLGNNSGLKTSGF